MDILIKNIKIGGEFINPVLKILKNNPQKIKKIFIIFSIISFLMIIMSLICYYIFVKSNLNYTESQAENIALELIDGAILRREKEIDDGILEYKFDIIDKNNIVREVSVSSKTGAIIDFD
ncbi:PepSY domain-containing protein [Clostridium neonatale]|uniref:PepSY domain-containing protein n=1 Tax=Clostridium neonatale TaxID=137838 RepID=UPI0029372618|nr:PepSY domain-containing protein [Clostridium neonatale]